MDFGAYHAKSELPMGSFQLEGFAGFLLMLSQVQLFSTGQNSKELDMVDTTTAIRRHHHITLCVGTAQEDYDFHTKVLGLKSVKKTALYEGMYRSTTCTTATTKERNRPS